MGKKPAPKASPDSPRSIENRRARYDYEVLDTWEAGMVLEGAEVKSVWLGRVNLVDAHCRIEAREAWIDELDIEPYSHASGRQTPRRRSRKLLLHRKEIDLLDKKAKEKGLALIPLKIYFSKGKVKVLIGLARGRKQFDKRRQIAEKEKRLEIERARGER